MVLGLGGRSMGGGRTKVEGGLGAGIGGGLAGDTCTSAATLRYGRRNAPTLATATALAATAFATGGRSGTGCGATVAAARTVIPAPGCSAAITGTSAVAGGAMSASSTLGEPLFG